MEQENTNNDSDVGLPNFEELDENQDGVLSEEEYNKAAPVENIPEPSTASTTIVWQGNMGRRLEVDIAPYDLTEQKALELLSEADSKVSWDDPLPVPHEVFENAGYRKRGSM
tara:strand:- start:8891 stop:9226 length:336 start_codon:yes stop_codon:yes gene_type:complete